MAALSDQRGVVYAEFVMAFTPFFLLFLGIIQLAFIAMGGVVVQTAAMKGARAAAVILPDDRFFYDGEREMVLDFQGSSDNSEYEKGLGDKLKEGGIEGQGSSSNESASADTGTGGPRLNAIRMATYLTLGILAPDPALLLTWVPSGLGLDNLIGGAVGRERYSLRKTAIGESPTLRFLTGFLLYNALGAAINFPKAPHSPELHNSGDGFNGKVDFSKLEKKEITVRVTYLFPCAVPIVNMIVCRKINPGPLWDTISRAGLDQDALDACGDSCKDVVATGQEAIAQGQEVIRDVKETYQQTKDEVITTYRGAKTEIEQQYKEAKGTVQSQYDGVKRGLVEQYEGAKRQARDRYASVKQQAIDTYEDAKEQAQSEYESARASAEEEYKRAKRAVEGQGREAKQRVEDAYREAKRKADGAYRDARREADKAYTDAKREADATYQEGLRQAEKSYGEARKEAEGAYQSALEEVESTARGARERAEGTYREGLEQAENVARDGIDEASRSVGEAQREAEEQLRELAPSRDDLRDLAPSGLPNHGGARPGGLPSLPSGASPGLPSGAPSLPAGVPGLPKGGLPGLGSKELGYLAPEASAKKVFDPAPAKTLTEGASVDDAPRLLDKALSAPPRKQTAVLPGATKGGDNPLSNLIDGVTKGWGGAAQEGEEALRSGEEAARGAAAAGEGAAGRALSGAEQRAQRGVGQAEQRAADTVREGEERVSGAVREGEERVSGAVEGAEDEVGGVVAEGEERVGEAVDELEGGVGDVVQQGEDWLSGIGDAIDDYLPDWFDDEPQSEQDKIDTAELRAGVKLPTLLDLMLRAPQGRFYVLRAEATLPLQWAAYAYPTAKDYEEQDEREQQEQQQAQQPAGPQASGLPTF